MATALPLSSDHAQALSLRDEIHRVEAGIVSRALINAGGLRLVLFTLAPGQELTEHTSTRRALVQILEGSCSFLFEGAWSNLGQGSLLHMPPGHLHAVRASDEGCSFLLTLTD